MGFSRVQAMMNNGRRVSASKAFLRPVKNRPTLNISPNSRVTKILINPDTKTAYGVEFVKNRRTYTVKARKEVIISAGSAGSPQLLMLSGIHTFKKCRYKLYSTLHYQLFQVLGQKNIYKSWASH